MTEFSESSRRTNNQAGVHLSPLGIQKSMGQGSVLGMPRKLAGVTVRVLSTLKGNRGSSQSPRTKANISPYSKRAKGRLKKTTVQSVSSHLQAGYARNVSGRYFQVYVFANNQHKFAKDLNKLTAVYDCSCGKAEHSAFSCIPLSHFFPIEAL